MAELKRLFGHCGLLEIESWVAKHSAIKDFFRLSHVFSETAESELKQIVEYRNEAAHGEVDQVLGTDVLIEVTNSLRHSSEHYRLRAIRHLAGQEARKRRRFSVLYRASPRTSLSRNRQFILKIGDIVISMVELNDDREIKSIQLNG